MLRKLLGLPMWAGLLIGVGIVIIIGLIFSSVNPWNPMNYFGKPATTVDVSRASVIKEIQSLNRLETASFTLDKIIEAGNEGNAFQNLIYGDRILLVAHGKVVAGIDMAKVTDDQVTVTGHTLKLDLPAPEIFSTTLDNDQTKVFDRKLGLLSKGDKDLETQARSAAESSLRQAACDGGILNEATKNAKDRITHTYQLVGFTSVEVTIPAGSC